MAPARGLKLALQGAGPDDRRIRFARLYLASAQGDVERKLVTDARGRMRYPLAPGKYVLSDEHGNDAPFAVAAGWTTVRLELP